MTLVALVVVLVVVLLFVLTSWLLWHSLVGVRLPKNAQPTMQVVDIAALNNLLRREDDIFLKKSLSPRCYRVAKRARTRAVQQYLMWIANGCAHVQLILRSQPQEFAEAPERARSLSALAFRLRVASLGLWTSLWLQRVFPQFDLMPTSLISVYENLTENLKLYIAVNPNGPSATAGTIP